MTQFFSIHPDNPQMRLIDQTVDHLKRGSLIVYPTDSAYALGCHIGDKEALDRIRALRRLDKDHNFTLMCRDLSQLSLYARVTNADFRFIKAHIPGPYTFILNATAEVPKRLMHPKRKTIGLRVPDNAIALALLERMGEPIMSSSLILPEEPQPLTDPWEIRDHLQHQVELIIDGGFCGFDPTTVIDMTGDSPRLIRQGCGVAKGLTEH